DGNPTQGGGGRGGIRGTRLTQVFSSSKGVARDAGTKTGRSPVERDGRSPAAAPSRRATVRSHSRLRHPGFDRPPSAARLWKPICADALGGPENQRRQHTAG